MYVPVGNIRATAATSTTRYIAETHYWLFPYVPCAITGAIRAGSQHCSTGAIDGVLIYYSSHLYGINSNVSLCYELCCECNLHETRVTRLKCFVRTVTFRTLGLRVVLAAAAAAAAATAMAAAAAEEDEEEEGFPEPKLPIVIVLLLLLLLLLPVLPTVCNPDWFFGVVLAPCAAATAAAAVAVGSASQSMCSGCLLSCNIWTTESIKHGGQGVLLRGDCYTPRVRAHLKAYATWYIYI